MDSSLQSSNPEVKMLLQVEPSTLTFEPCGHMRRSKGASRSMQMLRTLSTPTKKLTKLLSFFMNLVINLIMYFLLLLKNSPVRYKLQYVTKTDVLA